MATDEKKHGSGEGGQTLQGQILVVDDNRMNRIKLSRALEQQGRTADLAQNGREALQMLRERPYDVVLLDLVMPEMDGFEVLETMRADADLREIVVIVISAVDEMESIVRCIEMGATDYLLKPFDPVLLRARLETSLENKKLRDLERVYLQQELMLRQSEKLATLGKLSAGIAHELNNPAAAAQRSASQLLAMLDRARQPHLHLGFCGFNRVQMDAMVELYQRIAQRIESPLRLDSLTRSDRQDGIESWLADHGVEDEEEYAPDLVALNYEPGTLDVLAAKFERQQLTALFAWLSTTFQVSLLTKELSDATGRIANITKALKSYSYSGNNTEQAPLQQIDVHQGLDDTLAMLRHMLRADITVEREYAPDLPRIAAFGSELNQVWTNLIDNALAAMAGHGRLTLRTRRENDWVIVTVTDTGPGIPEEIQPRIFDPFFTTKPPGEGTGLGLNISHNIVVQKHHGQITVDSRPGKTSFQVRLPIAQPEASGS